MNKNKMLDFHSISITDKIRVNLSFSQHFKHAQLYVESTRQYNASCSAKIIRCLGLVCYFRVIFIYLFCYNIWNLRKENTNLCLCIEKESRSLQYTELKRWSKRDFLLLCALAWQGINTTHKTDPNYLIFVPILPYTALNYVMYQLVPKDHALAILAGRQHAQTFTPHAITLLC